MLQLRKKLAERAAADIDDMDAAAGADDGAPQQQPAKKRRKSKSQGAATTAAEETAGADSSHAIDVDEDDSAGGFERDEAEHKSPARSRSAASFAASRAASAAGASAAASAASPARRLAPHTTSIEDDDDDAPASAAAAFKAPSSDEDHRDQDEREAFVLPADGVVDASVLAKLPISLQYTVLQQQREHNRFHNFHKFSAVEHDPLKFSELQMASFLKSVKFSQSIDNMRKEMNLSVVPSAMRGASGADGSKLMVQGALRVPSNPAGGGYVYYKTDDPTQPFSWQAAIKNKKAADARAEKREQSKGKDGKRVNQREGMESVQEERDRLLAEEEREMFSAQLAAQAAVQSAQDEDWLCEHCSGVNSNLKRLASSAQKNTCQTCGTKREGVKEEDSMHPLQRGLMGAAKSNPASAFPSSLPAFATTPSSLGDQPRPVAGASTWVSPADRYSDGKPPTRPRMSAPAATAPPPSAPAFSIRPAPRASVARAASDELPALENAAARSRAAPLAAPLASTLHAALDARDVVSSCPHCTFINPLHARVCGMCEQPLSDDNVAMVTGPSSLAASFQAKAARRVAHLAAAAAPASSGRSAPIDFTTSSEPTVTITTQPPPAASASSSAVDLAGVSGPIDLSLDAIEAGGAPADGVDDLFADLLAAKSIAPMQLKSVASAATSAAAAPVAPASVALPSPSPSRPSQSIVSAASAPLQPSFLEISDDESVDAETAAAIASVEKAEAEAAARESTRLASLAETHRKLELQEAAQLRAATRASLNDPAVKAAAAASKRKPSGLSMHAAAPAAPVAAVLNLADLTASAATAEVIDDDVLWEEDEMETAAAPSVPATAQPVTAVEPAAAPSSPLPAVEEATAMDMSDSDDDAKPPSHAAVKVERTSSSTSKPPSSNRSAAAAPWLSGPARIPPRPASPAIEFPSAAAAAAPRSVTPDAQPAVVSASTAALASPPADEVMVSESSAADSADPEPALAPSALAADPASSSPIDLSIPLDDYDDVDRPDDDATTLRERHELRTLMAEFEVAKLRLAQAQAAASSSSAEEDAKAVEAATVESDEEDDDDQKSAYSIEQANAAAVGAAAPTSSAVSSSAVSLPFGLSLTAAAPPSAHSAASAAFREHQRQKRAQEAAEEKARQDATDRVEAEVLGQAAPAAASSTTEAGAVWEAFPSNLDAQDSIRLAASFDSSYLETNAAAREAAKARRGAEHVTEEMIADSKEILTLFGIPFIVAPGEAEAQCAVLESLKLVEGVITDDSDVFLFGASTVHRHFFEAKKYAESYRMKEITNKLGMDRRKLIHFALLLGSDYTEGVKGVGIVNATEILQAFPGERGLEELREWVYSTTELDLEPTLPVYPDDASDEERTAIDTAYRIALFKFKHRNTKRSWAMSRSFPNREIIDAYLRPNVDDSAAEITWGVPQWDKIRDMMERKLGWSAEVVSQTIDPVIKQMSEVRQGVLDRFFHPDDSFAAIGSARLSRAVQGLVHNNLTEEELQHQQQSTAKKAEQAEKRRVKAREKAALKRAEKAAAAAAASAGEGQDSSSAPAAGSADRSLFDDGDFALSAEDEAMLAAAEAKASPHKAPAPAAAAAAAAPKRSKSKTAAVSSSPAAKPKATRKRKSAAETNTAPSAPRAPAAATSPAAAHEVIDLD